MDGAILNTNCFMIKLNVFLHNLILIILGLSIIPWLITNCAKTNSSILYIKSRNCDGTLHKFKYVFFYHCWIVFSTAISCKSNHTRRLLLMNLTASMLVLVSIQGVDSGNYYTLAIKGVERMFSKANWSKKSHIHSSFWVSV